MAAAPLRLGEAYALRFSPDGALLAAVGGDLVAVFDARSGRRLCATRAVEDAAHLDFSPDGARIAVKGTSGRIAIVDARSGRTLVDYANQDEGEGDAVAFDRSGAYVLDGAWAGAIVRRPSERAAPGTRLDFPGRMVSGLSYARAADRLAAALVWKYVEGEPERAPELLLADGGLQRHTRRTLAHAHVASLALAPDAALCAMVVQDETTCLELIAPDTQAVVASMPIALGGTGAALAWSPDGALLGSVQDGRIALYAAPELRCVAVFPMDYPSSIAFAPQGDTIALGDWQNGLVGALDALRHHFGSA